MSGARIAAPVHALVVMVVVSTPPVVVPAGGERDGGVGAGPDLLVAGAVLCAVTAVAASRRLTAPC